MPDYIHKIKQNLERQVKLENTEAQYVGTAKKTLPLINGSLITIEMVPFKNNQHFKEDDKVLINNKTAAKIIDLSANTIIIKSKYSIKCDTTIKIRLLKSTTERLLDNINMLIDGKLHINHNTYESINNQAVEPPTLMDVNFFDSNLNESQRHAVKLAVGSSTFKLIGPPGTGKTTCIVEMILQLLQQKKKLLVCGPSNAALDNVMCAFVNRRSDCKIVRMGSNVKCNTNLKKYNLEDIIDNELKYFDTELKSLQSERQHLIKRKQKTFNLDKQIKKNTIEKHRKRTELMQHKIEESDIIFSTLYSTIKIQNKTFNTIIVDECCQANDGELLLSILKAAQVILIGDPYQLGPVNLVEQKDVLYDVFKLHTVMLKEQYRMSENLIAFANSYFYNSEIVSVKKSNFKFFDESNILFVDMFNSVYNEESHELSLYNTEEIDIIAAVLQYLSKMKVDLTIGIIVPYSAQVNKISGLNHFQLNLSVNTVDSFQGQERDIIIVSMVRSNYEQEIGFMNEIRRMNVALTRCKEGLIVIGNSTTFQNTDYYRKLFQFLDANAFTFDHSNFIVWLQDIN